MCSLTRTPPRGPTSSPASTASLFSGRTPTPRTTSCAGSRELGATVVRVGLAWQRFLRRHERPVLHDKDQSHPTLAGSYLAGWVFFAVLFQESPVGVDAGVAGLSGEDLAVLQEAAWWECWPATRRRSK